MNIHLPHLLFPLFLLIFYLPVTVVAAHKALSRVHASQGQTARARACFEQIMRVYMEVKVDLAAVARTQTQVC